MANTARQWHALIGLLAVVVNTAGMFFWTDGALSDEEEEPVGQVARESGIFSCWDKYRGRPGGQIILCGDILVKRRWQDRWVRSGFPPRAFTGRKKREGR